MRVLCSAPGFGGLELTTRISDALGDAADVTLIDKADAFGEGRVAKVERWFGRDWATH